MGCPDSEISTRAQRCRSASKVSLIDTSRWTFIAPSSGLTYSSSCVDFSNRDRSETASRRVRRSPTCHQKLAGHSNYPVSGGDLELDVDCYQPVMNGYLSKRGILTNFHNACMRLQVFRRLTLTVTWRTEEMAAHCAIVFELTELFLRNSCSPDYLRRNERGRHNLLKLSSSF
jgi:hypothetical protein